MPRVTSFFFLPQLQFFFILIPFNGVRVSFFLDLLFFSPKRKPWISHYLHLPLSALFLSPSVLLAFNSIFIFILLTVFAIHFRVRWSWILLLEEEEEDGLLVVLTSLMVITTRYFICFSFCFCIHYWSLIYT